MKRTIDRRFFLKTAGAIGAAAATARLGRKDLEAAEFAQGAPKAEKLGWRVACCAYTFNQHPLFEAIDRTASLGVKCIEGFAWQPLSKDRAGVQTNETMSADAIREMKKKLADSGVKLVSCYLSELPNKEDVCRKKFEWGKAVGLETFVAEPPEEALDLLERLCDEYQINLAIHNHPKPSSHYWNPETVAGATKGRSKRVGACADTGHWVRSGIDPVEACRMLEGRLIEFHLKDVAPFGKVDAEESPWGKGQGKIADILKEVRRQKIKTVFGIEYERFGYETRPEIAQSLAFLEKTAAELAQS